MVTLQPEGKVACGEREGAGVGDGALEARCEALGGGVGTSCVMLTCTVSGAAPKTQPNLCRHRRTLGVCSVHSSSVMLFPRQPEPARGVKVTDPGHAAPSTWTESAGEASPTSAAQKAVPALPSTASWQG
jgi:hypothetical protein